VSAGVDSGSVPVSIVVPAYNEAATIAPILMELRDRFPEAEVVVVTDGCTDETASVARACAPGVSVIEYAANKGKGHAVRTGMLAAHGVILLFTDADLPFGTGGVAKVLQVLETRPEVDIAIAEKTGAYRDPLYRAARGVVRLGVRWSLGLDQPDTQAGLKGFRRRAAQVIFSQAVVDGFAADMEMLGIAAREGFTVASVPLEVVNDALRPSTFTPSKGIHLVRDIWGIRRRLHR
jgi:dolichyl-phosphate beta-glucosyltransferase